jgi:flagellar hook-associated protein 2
VATTVSAIVGNLQAIETPWNAQLTALKSEDTALSSIGTDLSSLSTALTALTDFQGVLASKQGSSSNTNVLSLTSAGTSAVAGSHTVTVTALATTASYYSSALHSATDLLTGGLTVTTASGSQTITAGSGGETLAALVTTINSANAGVTASVINGTNGPELTVVSNTSGTAGNFTITGDTLVDSSQGNAAVSFTASTQAVQNAQLTVDGIPVNSASNTVANVIQGVTFQLLSTGSSQVEITNDNSAVESAVSAFVSAYNTVIGDLNTQEGDTATGSAEPLYGSPTIANLQESLGSAFNFIQAAQAVGTTTTVASTDALSGSLSISVGGGAAASIPVGAGGTSSTLAGLAAAINAAAVGVTASVITSGTTVVLSLANATGGSSGAITVNSSLTDATASTAISFGSSQSNAVTSATQLGISVNNNGTLTLNNDTLDSLLDTNYTDVLNFLQPAGGFSSFGANFTTALGNLNNTAPDGVVYLALQEDQSQETNLNNNITTENERISVEQANLTTELNQANFALQEIPSQLNEINEIYSSLSGYNQNPS